MFGENLSIGISLFMKDSFTSQAQRASDAMNKLRNNGDALARSQATNARNSAAAGALVGAAALTGVAQMYKAGAKFDQQLKYVDMLTTGSQKHMAMLKKEALHIANTSMFNPDDAASAMQFMGQAGLKLNDITASLDAAKNLAQATMSELGGEGGAADWMTSMAKGFSKGGEITKTEMEKFSDVMAIGVNKSKMTLGQMGEAMTYAMGTASRMGMTFQETAAAVGTMSNMGIKGSSAGVAVNNAITYASRAAGSKRGSKQFNALAQLGLSPQDLKDSAGQLLPIGEIITKIQTGMQKIGDPVEAQNRAFEIFGMRGQRAIAIGEHLKSYQELLAEMEDPKNAGYAKKMSDAIMDTPAGRLDELADSWTALKMSIGSSLFPVINPLVKGLSAIVEFAGKITETWGGKMLVTMVVGFIAIKTATMAWTASTLTLMLMKQKMAAMAGPQAAAEVTATNAKTAATNRQVAAQAALNAELGFGQMTASGRPDMRYRQNRLAMMPGAGGVFNAGRLGGGGKFGRFMGGGGGMGIAMGGMALQSLGGSLRDGTEHGTTQDKWGMGLDLLGSVAGAAGSGAMIGGALGTAFPIVGNAVGAAAGAIVGGSIALFTGIKGIMDETEADVKAANDALQAEKNAGGRPMNKDRLAREMAIYNSLKPNQRVAQGTELGAFGERTITNGQAIPLPGDKVTATIIVNVDGDQAMSQTIDNWNSRQVFNYSH